MIEPCEGGQTFTGATACPGASDPGPIAVADAVARFGREATTGVCDTGRYRMPYYVWGQGPPLVFVHGVADTARSFTLVISRLSAHFRCIAYTLPQGLTDGARLRKYRHGDLVEDLWALFDHLGLQRAYVLGSSFGSTVALAAMRARPERIPRAILQGGLARRPLRLVERLILWWLRFSSGPMTNLPRRDRILDRVHRPPFAGLPEERWGAFVEWTGEARLSALGHQGRWLGGVDLRPDLPHIAQPVLLLHGDRDSVVPRAQADYLLAHLPSAGLVILEGAGHLPYYTHPEAMAEVVFRFLTPPGPAHCPMPAGACSPAEQAACSGGRHPLPCSAPTVRPSS